MGYQLWVSSLTGYRRKGTEFKSLRKIFVDNVTAKSILEPLMCCPISSVVKHVKHALILREFDVAGVKETKSGEVVGYVVTDELNSRELKSHIKTIGPELLISDSTPIADIFMALMKRDFIFVLYGKHIIGIITKADVNKPPVRIYLFGMISLFEMHLNAWINHFYPKNAWKCVIKNERLNNAVNTYKTRKVDNQDLSLVECLQFCDKRDILNSSLKFINEFCFSKNKFDKFVKQVEKIRNELAHSQNSLISDTDWHRFVGTVNQLEDFLAKSDHKVEHKALRGNDFKDLLLPSV